VFLIKFYIIIDNKVFYSYSKENSTKDNFMKEVWIIIDDYNPDNGSDIIGCYSTYDLARKELIKYGTNDNEFGESQDTSSWDIRSLDVME